MRKINLVVLHHSGSTHSGQSVTAMRDYHKSIGYDDIAYHHIVDFDGQEYEGRPHNIMGAHTKGFNDNSLGLCTFGEFGLTVDQAETLVELCKRLKKQYNLKAFDFVRHKDLANTLCPAYDIDWLRQILTMD